MKDLKCGLTACVHNRAYCCGAKQIQVSKGTDCKTYQPNADKRRNMFEAGDDFVKRDYTIDTFVKCDADCVFNREKTCYANGITVMGDKDKEALCLSFIKD